MNHTIRESELQDIATEWFVRLQSDELTEREKQQFFTWLQADPAHQRAYIDIEEFWHRLGALENAKPATESSSGQAEKVIPLRRKPLIPAAMAACVALFLVGVIAFINISYQSNRYITAVGEQLNIKLSDGSHIILNTDSAIHTDLDEQRRLVHLKQGEAFFDVATDTARPFIVSTGNGLVRVLGTQFNVFKSGDGSSVITVLEGSVGVVQAQNIDLVTEPSFEPALKLAPNQQATLQEIGDIPLSSTVNADAITAWREGKLVYNGESFAKVLQDVNRYFEGEIRAGEPELEQQAVVAVLQLKDKNTTLRALEEAFNVASVAVSDELILLYPKK